MKQPFLKKIRSIFSVLTEKHNKKWSKNEFISPLWTSTWTQWLDRCRVGTSFHSHTFTRVSCRTAKMAVGMSAYSFLAIQHLGCLINTMFLHIPELKIWRCNIRYSNLGDWDYATGPPRPIHRPGNVLSNLSWMISPGGAPSCWGWACVQIFFGICLNIPWALDGT